MKNAVKQLVYKSKVNIGMEIGNYRGKELLLNIFQTQLNQLARKQDMNSINL